MSFAILTSMLFPLMTVLDTTGSIVHMVATAFVVCHPVMHTLKDGNMMAQAFETGHWSESFAP